MNIFFLCIFLINLCAYDCWAKTHTPKPIPKIVGLVQVRNEEIFIEQCLICLSHFVDAIVILDDGSEDNTLNIISKLANQLPIARIIANPQSKWEKGLESENQQALLDTGRQIGGTHFIFIDADEIITSNCLKNNMLKTMILGLKPGDTLGLMWIQFWRSPYHYRYDNSQWTGQHKDVIFCDDKKANYENAFLHGSRLPKPLNGKQYRIPGYDYGIMHFQFVNWENLLIKQAWYRCLERVRYPTKSTAIINQIYAPSKNETNLNVVPAPTSWFQHYPTFNSTIYMLKSDWRKEQVLQWFKQYGKNYFKDLDIWDVNWEK